MLSRLSFFFTSLLSRLRHFIKFEGEDVHYINGADTLPSPLTAAAMGVPGTEAMSQEEYRQAAIDAVRQLGKDVGIPQKVSEVGVREEDIDFLADSAMADACTPGNPKDSTKEDIVALYRSMM